MLIAQCSGYRITRPSPFRLVPHKPFFPLFCLPLCINIRRENVRHSCATQIGRGEWIFFPQYLLVAFPR